MNLRAIAENLHAARARIERTARQCGRGPSEIALLTVSKTFPAPYGEAAHEAGQRASRLNDARPSHLPPLNVCIQINVSGEATKHGVTPGAEQALAAEIMALPRLRLRGLMAIPEPGAGGDTPRSPYARLRALKDSLVSQGYPLDTLSMGMSDDLEAAIAEGATIVRVGTAIFGSREA